MSRTRDISNIFDDNSPIVNDNELIIAINTASVAAVNYTNNELGNIDLTNTIVTASAAAVNYLIDGAPGALNTLNELAAALNDDQSFASSVLTTISNASAAALSSANTYTDNATPDLTPAIQAASAAAVAYTDQELATIDLTSTIVTASAAAVAYTDQELNAYIPYSSASPSTPQSGNFWLNSNNSILYVWNGSEWSSTINQDPIINSIGPSTIDGQTGNNISINGQYFESGCFVTFIGNNNSTYNATATQFINSASVIAITPSLPAAYTPYDVKITNPGGNFSIYSNMLDIGSPYWNISSGNIGNILDEYSTYSSIATITASDPNNNSISYSSTGLPNGLSINSSTGVISGNPDNVSSSTTYNFSVTATDSNSNSINRSFNIIVSPAKDGSSAARAATSALSIKQLTGTDINGAYWIKPDGWSNAYQTYCIMDDADGVVNDNGGWTLAYNMRLNETWMKNLRGTNGYTMGGFWTDSSPTMNGTELGVTYDMTQSSRAIGAYINVNNIMIMYHNGTNSGSGLAYSIYSRRTDLTTNSLRTWFNNNTRDLVFSSTGRSQRKISGWSEPLRNTDRPWPFGGDVFMSSDNNGYNLAAGNLVLNGSRTGYGYQSDTANDNRFITTSVNRNEYGHTFGGIGGYHTHSGYGATFIATGVYSYCDGRASAIYGDGSQVYTFLASAICHNASHTTTNSAVSGVSIFIK